MAGLDANTPSPTSITVHQRSRVLEVGFSNGKTFRLPFELLRVYSPSAEVRGHGPGQEVLQVGKQDIDQKKFAETFNSFTVQSKVARVRQLQDIYRIEGVPTIAIDGQYVTSPATVGRTMRNASEEAMNAATRQVMDALVAKKAK